MPGAAGCHRPHGRDPCERIKSWLFGFFPKAFSLHHARYKNAKPHLMANKYTSQARGRPHARCRNKGMEPARAVAGRSGSFGLLFVSLIPAIRDFHTREE